MGLGKDVLQLENALGYHFTDISLLENAVTHASYANEVKSKGISFPSNERLEFLGDAVLQIVVSEYLFDRYSNYDEGALTKMRQMIVCEKTLSRVARQISLGEYIHIGNGEEKNGCRERPKVLADTLEAVFAALYLDKTDKNDCKQRIISFFETEIRNCCAAVRGDAKTVLQQLVEQDGSSTLTYELLGEEGPAHNKVFHAVALVNRNAVGEGKGTSIKDAQMEAARAALSLFGYSI